MELWVRSQDKERLFKINGIYLESEKDKYYIMGFSNDYCWLGHYKTNERALEVLDDIQGKLQNKFLCKPTCILKAKDIYREENILNWKYNERFIMQPPTIDIEPINSDIVVYEMPKE